MTNYLDWKVGDQVICVNTEPPADEEGVEWIGDLDGLEEGSIYTIREFANYDPDSDEIGIRLKEIIRPFYHDSDFPNYESPYAMWRFRKLQKRKTDISVFTAMLNQTLLTNQIELTVKERMPENV